VPKQTSSKLQPTLTSTGSTTILLEKEVCKALRTYWKKWGFFYIRNQQGLGSKRGTADYTIVRDGRTIFVEAKATRGKQGEHQIAFQTELEAAGGSYYMVHSLEEFIEAWQTEKMMDCSVSPGIGG